MSDDYDYNGWAPCAHHDEDRAKAVQFVRDQTPDFSGNINPKYEGIQGGLLEDMIWQLTDLTRRGEIQFDCDQWWGVFVTGTIEARTFRTRVQGDTLLLAVAETLRWWDEKYKDLRPKKEVEE